VSASRFSYEALPGRVVFGPGAIASAPAEVERLGAKRAVLFDGLFEKSALERLIRDLGPLHAATVGEVRQHVPADLVAGARARVDAVGADCLLALGGGSATGLAKAVALETGLPIIAVPTTYAGSEMTPIWGITAGRRKETGRDPRVLPRTVLYDPELTLTLPPRASAASGMNAIAHCVEATWTPAANPVTDAVASDGIRRLAQGLRGCVRRPGDLAARTTALQGAWLGGTALAVGATGLHHRICHVLGGSFDLPHAEVHAVVLPWVVDYYRDAAPAALARVAGALDSEDAVAGLRELARDLGLSFGLSDLGLDRSDLEPAAELAAAVAPQTPAPAGRDEILGILERAMDGGAR
jgi:maleylacetate reductase